METELMRIGVSFLIPFLVNLMRLSKRGYSSRSEAIRDSIRVIFPTTSGWVTLKAIM